MHSEQETAIKMLIDTLTEIAYLYYPRDVSNLSNKEQYLKSAEYDRLEARLNEFSNTLNQNETYRELLDSFKLHNFDVHDVSILHWQDRCISFEINNLIDSKLKKICIQISILLPYFYIYAIEVNINPKTFQYLESPRRIDLNINLEVNKTVKMLSSIIMNTTKFTHFPNEIADILIPDISFNDIDKGSFTFYNAFFLNSYLYED